MKYVDEDGKGRAHWEWLRTANPWLPPFDRLSTAGFDLNISTRDLEMKVVLDWPSEPFRFDPWADALEREGRIDDMAWDDHLSAALRWFSGAMKDRGRVGSVPYRNHLVQTAVHVRAMAPEGVLWDAPWPVGPGHERGILRAVPRALLAADEYRETDGLDPSARLRRVDSYLHGLWLASKEGGNG
jgi:hypothetical protein